MHIPPTSLKIMQFCDRLWWIAGLSYSILKVIYIINEQL